LTLFFNVIHDTLLVILTLLNTRVGDNHGLVLRSVDIFALPVRGGRAAKIQKQGSAQKGGNLTASCDVVLSAIENSGAKKSR